MKEKNKQDNELTDNKKEKKLINDNNLENDLGNELIELRKKLSNYENLLKKIQAEFENYRKRVERNSFDLIDVGKANLIKELLPVIDDFEKAFKHSNEKQDFFNGIKLIKENLIKILEKQGLKKMNSLYTDFDPFKHEALMKEPSEKKENQVIEVFEEGYFFKDKLLRPAKVKIAKPIQEENNNKIKNKNELNEDNKKKMGLGKQKNN